jgi:4-alpha-glucanotransferase
MTRQQESLRPDAWGLHPVWVNAEGQQETVTEQVLKEFRALIGRPPADLAHTGPLVVRPGGALPLDVAAGEATVVCEDGRLVSVPPASEGTTPTLPDDVGLGYHRLRTTDSERRLIVSPGRCWLPENWRAWGLAVQVYALRSQRSWGIGDLADLRAVREWAQHEGAGFLLVNPLHAVALTSPQEASPYLPATRRFLNPVYLRVDEVPGADGVDLTEHEARAAALPTDDIDRDAVWEVKRAALRQVFDAAVASGAARDATAWSSERGRALQEFAQWSALVQECGPDWRRWPEDLRRPDSPAVARFADEHADDVAFHVWLQWALDHQLRAATGDMTVLQDLPIGVGGAGADSWAWQDQLADGVMVGAPPDAFNAAGQEWGSPPFVPWRLQAAHYEPFIESVRSTLAGSGGIRIDHVMGLFRLWWVPAGGSPIDGAYMRYPSDDLLDIVALESHRAQALVVGEDLGTVEPGVRETLAEYGVLSYKVLWFEDSDPAQWSESAMAAVTTHDLPTIAGLWTGDDAAEQVELGLATADEVERGRQEILARLTEGSDLPPSATAEQAVEAAHRMLGRAPSVLLSATLDDAVAARRRPNVPGTSDRANWRLPLPVSVEDLPQHFGAQAVVKVLATAVQTPSDAR